MPGTEVTVHVNRESTDGLEAERTAVETDGSFAVLLQGHETPAHVHCRLAGDLERIASLGDPNYYVEPDAVTAVPVSVNADAVDRPVEGGIEVLAGYGSESVAIDVTVVPGPPAVDVDESLSEPARTEPEPTVLERTVAPLAAVSGLETGTLAVLALGLLAVGIAAMTAATIGGPVTTVGLGIVVAGVAAALVLLVR